MLIYQKTAETDKLNILFNVDEPAGLTIPGDIVLTKTIVGEEPDTESVVSASFASIDSTLDISGSSATATGNNIIISGQAKLTGGSNATISATLTLPIINADITNKLVCRDNNGQVNLPVQVGAGITPPGELQSVNRGWVENKIAEGITDVANGTVSGTIKVTKNGSTINALVYGWNTKIESLTAGSFITITGTGDSRTIAVTNATIGAVADKLVQRNTYGNIVLPAQSGSALDDLTRDNAISKGYAEAKFIDLVSSTLPGTIRTRCYDAFQSTPGYVYSDFKISGWDDKIGSIAASTGMTVTGGTDSKTIAFDPTFIAGTLSSANKLVTQSEIGGSSDFWRRLPYTTTQDFLFGPDLDCLSSLTRLKIRWIPFTTGPANSFTVRFKIDTIMYCYGGPDDRDRTGIGLRVTGYNGTNIDNLFDTGYFEILGSPYYVPWFTRNRANGAGPLYTTVFKDDNPGRSVDSYGIFLFFIDIANLDTSSSSDSFAYKQFITEIPNEQTDTIDFTFYPANHQF